MRPLHYQSLQFRFLRIISQRVINSSVKYSLSLSPASFSRFYTVYSIKSIQSVPENTEINVRGWIKSVRSFKNVSFIDVSDGTCEKSVMAVAPPSAVKGLTTGCSVDVTGIWQKSQGKNQSFELKVQENGIELLGSTEEEYPLQKKYHSPQFIRSLPTLKFHTSKLSSVMRFRSFLETCLIEFFNSKDFTKVSPPLITGSDCEGAGELFQVESESSRPDSPFFGRKAYLTVSTQLHLEIMAQSLSKVWTLTPCFRAEPSDTNRHLSEFWMVEAEIAFLKSVNELTGFSKEMILYIVKCLVDNKNSSLDNLLNNSRRPKEELQEIEIRLNCLLRPWTQMSYKDAIEFLSAKSHHWEYLPPVYGKALTTEHEKYITSEIGNPVFVTDYPKDEKAFYMKINEDNSTVACFDLLFPVMGELIGGSVREENYGKLLGEVERRSMNVDELDWYMSLRQNGTVSHGGFGMGFERLVCYLCNLDNIKDSVMISRSVDNCDC